ncbi:hypothetical protein AMTR_s00058p00217020 [Amborella trichopoda]|uniref:Uncharacterized protein n=1 Tax=Amborella trichopoda TaxID=13333 RepID=W1P9Z8_AMBTC|nr:hypothetical protein AMTR_s00058p00217020 [Amborella trichopoda]
MEKRGVTSGCRFWAQDEGREMGEDRKKGATAGDGLIASGDHGLVEKRGKTRTVGGNEGRAATG